MINYQRLSELKPTVYCEFVNSKGQKIKLVEHPLKGDSSPVVVMCDDLRLAAYSTFYETNDLTAQDKEYEPYFEDGKLWEGNSMVD